MDDAVQPPPTRNGEPALPARVRVGHGRLHRSWLHAIRARDLARHHAWMSRAYALALGAGTQVITQGIGQTVFGISELTTDLGPDAGWPSTSRSPNTSFAAESAAPE